MLTVNCSPPPDPSIAWVSISLPARIFLPHPVLPNLRALLLRMKKKRKKKKTAAQLNHNRGSVSLVSGAGSRIIAASESVLLLGVRR